MSAAEDSVTATCSVTDCHVAETGRCVDGFDLQACPHYGSAPEEPSVSDARDELDSTKSANIVLPSADSLGLAGASSVLRRSDARVIAIIGPRDAGKTSLIASLYDLFQAGPVSEMRYAGSQTLHAFELACHNARASSRRTEPDTFRTPLGGVRFFHLDLAGGPAGKGMSIVLGDRAGEEYQEVADDVSVAATFAEVCRAEALTLLIDGQRLVDAAARHNLRSDIIMLLRGLVAGGAVQSGQRLALVLTKIDVLRELDRPEKAENDYESFKKRIEELFGHEFSTIQSFEIAAAPKTDVVPQGTGVPELLVSWLAPKMSVGKPTPVKQELTRAFARVMPLDD